MLQKCYVIKSDPSPHMSRGVIAGMRIVVDHIGLDISYQSATRRQSGIADGTRDSDKRGAGNKLRDEQIDDLRTQETWRFT